MTGPVRAVQGQTYANELARGLCPAAFRLAHGTPLDDQQILGITFGSLNALGDLERTDEVIGKRE